MGSYREQDAVRVILLEQDVDGNYKPVLDPSTGGGGTGADGKTVLNGTVDPTTEGVDGDFYINTTSYQIFGPKTGGAWGAGTDLIGPAGADGATGPAGADGADGLTVLNGTVDPTTEGVDGDFYINTSAHTIFGPKTAGAWGSGTSLVGPTGATGADGADGAPGPADLSTFDTGDLAEGTNQYFTTERAQDAVGAMVADSSTIDATYNDAGNAESLAVIQSGLDHGSIGGLADDDHTQYHTDSRADTWYAAKHKTVPLDSEVGPTYNTDNTARSLFSSVPTWPTPAAGEFIELNGYFTHTNTSGSASTVKVEAFVGSTSICSATTASIASGSIVGIAWRCFLRCTTAGASGAVTGLMFVWRSANFSTVVAESIQTANAATGVDVSSNPSVNVKTTMSVSNAAASITSYILTANRSDAP